MISQHDKDNIEAIIRKDHGDWFTAHVLRFLNVALFKADSENKRKLHTLWPQECRAIYAFNGWPEDEIDFQMKIFSDDPLMVILRETGA